MNYPKSEKSKGVVLVAYNTDQFDYVSIAQKSTKLIKKYLNLPVCLITDSKIKNSNFDYIINLENNTTNFRAGLINSNNWKNKNRYLTYSVSPFETTILLDTDYLILSDNLLKLIDITVDYQILNYNNFLIPHNERLGPMSLQTIWATIIIFQKTTKSELLFKLAGRIQRNYNYYCDLYNIQAKNFRNDFAFTIANNIINGYAKNQQNILPFQITTFDNQIETIVSKENKLVIKNSEKAWILPKHDIHIMDKAYLVSENFAEFIDIVTK